MKNQMNAVQTVVTTADSRVAQHRAPGGAIGAACSLCMGGRTLHEVCLVLGARAKMLFRLFGKESPDGSLPPGWDADMFETQVMGAIELMARKKVKIKDMDAMLVTVSKVLSATTGKHELDVLRVLQTRVTLASLPEPVRLVMQATNPIAALGEERRREQHLVDAAVALAQSRMGDNSMNHGRRGYVHGARVLATA